MAKNLFKRVYQFSLVVVFLLLAVRLFFLTGVKGSYYLLQAEENRIRKRKLPAPRGIIYDRHQESLVENVPIYYQGEERISRERYLLEQESLATAGRVEFKRRYKLAEQTAAVLGFLGPISLGELVDYPCSDKVDEETWVGRGGVEEQYDCLLQGKPGWQLLEENIGGEATRIVGEVAFESGEDLILTIDKDLQKKAAEVLSGQRGALIVSAPQNGEILALASWPNFDPNIFTYRRNEERINRLLHDDSQPFLNRAISARFPPGSVFKLLSGLAALEEGEIDPGTKIEDTGVIRVGDYEYSNWYYTEHGQKEGQIDIVKALQRSNDIFFYRVGEYLGVDKMVQWADKFALRESTGIDLPAEISGFMPTAAWKQETLGEGWFLGNDFHLAIGQGYLALTPLEVNVMTNVFASGGQFCTPRVRKGSADCRQMEVDPTNLAVVEQGLQQACMEGGTGYPFFDFTVRGEMGQVACKTGTAEFDSQSTHAWFTMYAPINRPEISITVFLERGGSGAEDAAPLAKEMAEYYFNKKGQGDKETE